MRHKRWLKLCLKLTRKSKMSDYKHAAVLVKGGRVIAIGLNKRKAGMLADKVYGEKAWHSEADCLLSIHKEKIRGAYLYSAGKTKTGKLVNSKPCPCCQEFIKKYRLKGVFYHDEYGNVHRYA
jgi:deoxycytidylate deaminase